MTTPNSAASAAQQLYACCEHCTHDPGYDPDLHTIRCPDGCNDTVA